MICSQCRRNLRSGEGIRCSECDSKYHVACVSETQELLESGDLGYHWTCALCQHPAGKSEDRLRTSSGHVLMAMNTISEKFEMVNKIQLPRLSHDILYIMNIADRIAKQNESILRTLEELKNRREVKTSHQQLTYRRRHLSLMPRTKHSEQPVASVLPGADKLARYRTRRRPNTLQEMFFLLNKKLR